MAPYGVVALVLASLLWPASSQAVSVPAANVPTAIAVAETGDDLLRRGCQPFAWTATQAHVEVASGLPYHVVSTSAPEQHFWCSPATAAGLTPVAGQVAGIRQLLGQDAQAQSFLECALTPVGCAIHGIYNRAGDIAEGATYLATKEAGRVVSWLASAAGALGILLIYAGSGLLGSLITQGGFITNDAVRVGWPIIQGLANIGFVVALLYIAFATTLNLNIGNQAPRRFLPRLLIAAILLNFSLVLAGILIDASRLLNAIIIQLMLNVRDPAAIGPHLLQSSQLIEQNFDIALSGWMTNLIEAGKNVAFQGWLKDYHEVIGLALGAALIWAYALVMWFLIVLFFFRYVVLVVLLVFSPLAFLTSVLPNTRDAASKWWQQFWKWTFFGPAALFILALAVRIQGDLAFVPDSFAGADLMNSVANVTLMVVMLYVAATVGKYIGGSAATLAMAVSKRGSDAVRQYGGAGLKTGTRVGVLPYTYAGQQLKDFSQKTGSQIVKKARAGDFTPVGKFLAGPERDKDGNLKPGQVSAGSYLAGQFNKAIGADLTKEERQRVNNARQAAREGMERVPGSDNTKRFFRQSQDLRADQLRREEVAENMDSEELAFLATSEDVTSEQRQAILRNPAALKKLLKERPQVIQQVFNEPTEIDLPTNTADQAVNARNRETITRNRRNQKMINALNRGLAALERKNRGKA